jgi:multicomponent Na+:H+ antiporter subunit D
LVYGLTGTLNMAHLHIKLRMVADPGLVAAVAVLFLTAFGIKSGLFPLFFWLPASYHTPPVAIGDLCRPADQSGRVCVDSNVHPAVSIRRQRLRALVLVVAAATMIVGVLGAATHNHVRRILSFHIISQVGYMVLGLGLFTPLALAGRCSTCSTISSSKPIYS